MSRLNGYVSLFTLASTLTSMQMLGSASHDNEHEHEHKKYEVYYDESWRPLPLLATGNMTTAQHQRFPLRRYGIMPCECMELQCGCCVNTNFFSTKRSGCMNMTYDPDEFAIGMNMLWNGESVYQNSVSAKNPPPACMEAPVPYLPSIQFCMRLYDIYTPGRNIHMCVNFETRLARAPILVLEFDCFQMGLDGLDYLKPNSSTTRPIIENPLSGLVPSGEEASGAGGGEEPSGSEGAASDASDSITESHSNVPTPMMSVAQDHVPDMVSGQSSIAQSSPPTLNVVSGDELDMNLIKEAISDDVKNQRTNPGSPNHNPKTTIPTS